MATRVMGGIESRARVHARDTLLTSLVSGQAAGVSVMSASEAKSLTT